MASSLLAGVAGRCGPSGQPRSATTPAGSAVVQRRAYGQRLVAAAAGGQCGSRKKGGSGKAAAPVADEAADLESELAAVELAEEREGSMAAAAALSAVQQARLDALAEAISQRLEKLADSEDWTPDQMLSDPELEGFVEFGADPDAALAAQRSASGVQQALAGEEEVADGDGGSGRRSRRGRQEAGDRKSVV